MKTMKTLIRLRRCAGWYVFVERTYQKLRFLTMHFNYDYNFSTHYIIGIKHGFSCINIRQVPWEVLKTEAGGRGFQHLPRDLANFNA